MSGQQLLDDGIELDEELESKIQEVFGLHDFEQENRILSSEVINAFKLIPVLKDNPQEVERQVGNEFKSDFLSLAEFRNLAALTIATIRAPEQEMLMEQEKEELKNAFRVLARKDKKNRNKKDDELCVDFKVVKNLLKSLDADMEESEIDKMVYEADKDKNGTIEIDEFVDFMMQG